MVLTEDQTPRRSTLSNIPKRPNFIADAKVRVMSKAATSSPIVTWLVLSLALFSGLVCGLGHGQLMAAFVFPSSLSRAMSSMADCGNHGHALHPTALPDNQSSSPVPLHVHGDAGSTWVFASKLFLALALSVTGWWLGHSGDRYRRRLPSVPPNAGHFVLIAHSHQAP